MRVSHGVWMGLGLVAWLAGAMPARADEAWTLASFYDAVNRATVRIAAVRNAQDYSLKVYAPSHEKWIWAVFLLPSEGPEVFETEPALRFEAAGMPPVSGSAVTAAIAERTGEDPAGLRHCGPRYIALVIGEAGGSAAVDDLLRSLMGGGVLRVRYTARTAGPRETAFTLNGADAAIGAVLALLE